VALDHAVFNLNFSLEEEGESGVNAQRAELNGDGED